MDNLARQSIRVILLGLFVRTDQAVSGGQRTHSDPWPTSCDPL